MSLEIVRPDPRFHVSFLEAMVEHARVGDTMQGVGSSHLCGAEDPVRFARFVRELREAADPAHVPPGRVSADYWWLVEGEEYLGGVTLRHAWPEGEYALVGGNIGYSVRPSARRRGYATRLARHALAAAAARGLASARISHEQHNVGSQRVILTVGGQEEGRHVLSDDGHTYIYYAVPTAPHARTVPGER